ncbi:hypothetical protein EYF80_060842 [Liparis tanakae]|uniref:Uncharacterized protein n=1 Tax=Liparis tanakae TaxID=230148 RepID=A0A4Z2EJN7_9TELE|nr:hypothetical protein EYF80_060842 [Liparis tanakae]
MSGPSSLSFPFLQALDLFSNIFSLFTPVNDLQRVWLSWRWLGGLRRGGVELQHRKRVKVLRANWNQMYGRRPGDSHRGTRASAGEVLFPR